MVPRLLALLLLLAGSAVADGRDAWVEARDVLTKAYFDQLDPEERDKWFKAYGSWDHAEVIPPLAEIVSNYGAYLDLLAAQMADRQKRLEPFKDRRALSEQEVGLRNSHTRALEKLEFEWRRARASEDILVKVAGSYREPRTIQAALSTFERHASSAVRQLLARACAHWHVALADAKTSNKAFASLKKLQRDADPAVRVAVARAMGAYKRQEALDLLAAATADDDWSVRAAAVQSLARTGTSEAVTVLIETMLREKGRLRDDINTLLKGITGEDFGFAESWAAWWKAQGEQLPRKRTPTAGNAEEPGPGRDEARFYGIPTRSQRICFIIDVSGSMNKEVEEFKRVVITGRKETDQPVEGKTRIEVARNELKRAVSNLSPEKLFTVIFFNQAVRTWRPKMEKATPAAKEALRKDVDVVVASVTTYTLGALREAFALAGVAAAGGKPYKKGEIGVDTIFLLSDGGPTDNRMDEAKPMDPEIILESVRQWNRDAGIVIHTIAVDTEAVGTYFLKQLAAQNGGEFVERKK